MNTHRFFTVLALALLLAVSTSQAGFGAPWDFDEISQGPGFREVWNRYTYTQIYYEGDPGNDNDDAVYFGTYNQRTPASGVDYGSYDPVNGISYGTGISFGPTISKGGRIYKYHVATGQWSLIWPNVDNIEDSDPENNFNTNDFGMRIAEVYDPPGDDPDQGAKIYFGTYTSSGDGAKLMVIDPADDSVGFIEPAAGEGGNWGGLVSVRAMAVFNGKLWLGSEYFPGKLWSYDGTNLKYEWARSGFNYNISELEVYGDYLYIGGWFSAALYRTDGSHDGQGNLNVETVSIGAAASEEGVMSMEVFKGKLFVGMSDRTSFGGDGFSLFYYESVDDPEPNFITQNGLGVNASGYAWVMKNCGNLLFMGAYTESGGSDEGLWATSNGLTAADWTDLPNSYNPTSTEYGARSLSCGVPADGIERLFYGTAANQASPSTPRFTEATRIFRIEGPFTALPATP